MKIGICLLLVYIVAWFTLIGLGIWAACHFIHKFW